MIDLVFISGSLNGMYYSPYPNTKLFIDMVPVNAWYQNLRNREFVTEHEWRRLRWVTARLAGKRCEVCGGQGPKHPVECHEQWHFDQAAGVQTLRSLVALCPTCHAATHYGFSTNHNTSIQEGALRDHLANINGWTLARVDEHVDEATEACKRLNGVEWTLNLTLLERGYSDLLSRRTLGLLNLLHSKHNLATYQAPTDTPQPKRSGVLVPARVPASSEPYPWSREWVEGWDCEEVLVAMLGESVASDDLRRMLATKDWSLGMPMYDLRQEALAWVLSPLVAKHAGDAQGFFDAVACSPLVPIAQRSHPNGPWTVAYGLKAEMYWKVSPRDWVLLPAAQSLRWEAVATAIAFDDQAHADRLEAWSSFYTEVYGGQVLRLSEMAVLDSAYVKL